MSPLAAFSTVNVVQPYDWNRAGTSSVNVLLVLPSIWIYRHEHVPQQTTRGFSSVAFFRMRWFSFQWPAYVPVYSE